MSQTDQIRIHPQAIVEEGAQLSAGVIVDAFATIGPEVRIGSRTHVRAGARLTGRTIVGEECVIYEGAVIGTPPQDLKYADEPTATVIGDRTTIRECATVHRGTVETGETRVGSDCLLMAYTHVAHDCRIGDRVILANGTQLGGHVQIDDWAILGGLVGVHQFERIGAHAMVGAGYRVMKDVPPFVVAGRDPIQFLGVNIVGLRRRGFDPDSIARIRDAYRTIYERGKNVSEALAELASVADEHPEIHNIVEFVRLSRRGVIPGRRS